MQKQGAVCGANMQGCGYFDTVPGITAVNNPWDDIWGSGIDSSLVMRVYNASSYHANLAFTV